MSSGRGPLSKLPRVALMVLAATLVSCSSASTVATPSPMPSNSATTGPVSTSTPTLTPMPTLAATPSPVTASGFRPLSLTFVSATDGWVLGTGVCPNSCVWIYHTTNGGATWTRSGAPPATSTGCYDATAPCVDTLRFATPELGFAFGINWGAVYRTDDGGATWTLMPVTDVSAMALVGDDALRLQASDGGCSTGECQLKRSTDGGTIWSTADQPVLTPEGLQGDVFLQADGHAYMVGYGNPAGGGPETAELYRSSTFGATWTPGTDPCANGSPGRPITVDVDAAAAGVLGIDCLANLGDSQRGFVLVSTDGGAHFGPAHASPASFQGFAIASASVLAEATSAGLSVSHDGGVTWTSTYSCPAENKGDNGIAFVGFESATVAHLMCGDSIARSADGGLKWTTYTFPS
jgi:photosystem II stability/assembly factor-like uncharacterized protein